MPCRTPSAFCLVLLTASLAGCGDSPSGGKGDKPPAKTPTSSVGVATPAPTDPAAAFIGAWVLDLETTVAALSKQMDKAPEMEKSISEYAITKAKASTIALELRADGTFARDYRVTLPDAGRDEKDRGTWKVDAQGLVLMSITERNGQPVSKSSDYELKDGRLEWVPDASGTTYLRRK